MRPVQRRLALLACLLLLGQGCASVQVRDNLLHARLPWAPGPDATLGHVSVWPETDWRADQKEPASRAAMAETAIAQAFRDFPHGNVSEIRPIAPHDAATEPARLQAAQAAGNDAVIQIRVSELGPLLLISVPVLWSTYSDVKFRLRIVRLADGESLLDVERHRQVGGPFVLRGTAPLAEELEIALCDALALPPR